MPDKIQNIAAAAVQSAPETDRYYKIQIKAWAKFDPTNAELMEIAQAVERGAALLTSIEVTRVANDVKDIDDLDVREQFEIVAAAERLVHKVEDLPKSLRDKLRDVLASQEQQDRIAS